MNSQSANYRTDPQLFFAFSKILYDFMGFGTFTLCKNAQRNF